MRTYFRIWSYASSASWSPRFVLPVKLLTRRTIMSMDGGNRPVAANTFLILLYSSVTCCTNELLAIRTLLSFGSVVVELRASILVISFVMSLERAEHGDVEQLDEVCCVGWNAKQQNLAPLLSLEDVR